MVVSVSGYSDLKRLHETRAFFTDNRTDEKVEFGKSLRGSPEEVPERYTQGSPLTYVSADDPPVLSFHEQGDLVTPVEQVGLLDAKLKEFGVPHAVLPYTPLAGREWVVSQDGTIGDEEPEDALFDFFDEHLKGGM